MFGALYYPAAGVVFVAAVARLCHTFTAVLVLRQNAVYPAFRYLLIDRIAVAFFLRRAIGVQPQYAGYLVAGIVLVARFPLRARLRPHLMPGQAARFIPRVAVFAQRSPRRHALVTACQPLCALFLPCRTSAGVVSLLLHIDRMVQRRLRQPAFLILRTVTPVFFRACGEWPKSIRWPLLR